MSHRSRALGRLAAVSASRGALLSTSAAARRKGIDAAAATASRSMYEAHKRDVMPPPGWDPTLVDRVVSTTAAGLRVRAGVRGMGSRKQATALAEDDERRLSPGSPLQLSGAEVAAISSDQAAWQAAQADITAEAEAHAAWKAIEGKLTSESEIHGG